MKKRDPDPFMHREHGLAGCLINPVEVANLLFHLSRPKKPGRNVNALKQTSPSGGKPFLPLAALGSSAILARQSHLASGRSTHTPEMLMGASHQYIARSQQPYSLDAQSEYCHVLKLLTHTSASSQQ